MEQRTATKNASLKIDDQLLECLLRDCECRCVIITIIIDDDGDTRSIEKIKRGGNFL